MQELVCDALAQDEGLAVGVPEYSLAIAFGEAGVHGEPVELLEAGCPIPDGFEKAYRARIQDLENDLVFLESSNLPGEFMEAEDLERLGAISKRHWAVHGEDCCLSDDELNNLSMCYLIGMFAVAVEDFGKRLIVMIN